MPTSSAPLSSAREARLIRKAHAGSTRATEEILRAHEPLIASIVARFPVTASVARDDLLQEGRLGFLEALSDFDPAQGARLNTKARHYVRKAVSEAVSEGGAIAIPARTLSRYLAAWKGVTLYSAALAAATSGEHPMGPGTFAAVHEALHGVLELDRPDTSSPEGGEGTSLHEIIPSPTADSSHVDGLHALVGALPEDHRAVIVLAFGLSGDEPMIDSEVARHTGLSRQKVQRLRVAALDLMAGEHR